MLTAASALRWEIRRAVQTRLLTLFLVLLFIPSLTLVYLIQSRMRGFEVPESMYQITPQTHFPLIIGLMVTCLFGIGQAVGLSSRQYTLPIRTTTLATSRLLVGASCCALLYLVIAWLMNVLTLAGWPVLGPALTFGVGYMAMYATAARYRGNDSRMGVSGFLMAVVLLFWVGSHYGSRWWLKIEHQWSDLSAGELVFLVLGAVGSWRCLVNAIDRDRRGAGLGRVVEVRDRTAIQAALAARRPARRFGSSMSALFWQEWREDGWLVSIVVASIMAVIAAIHLSNLVRYGQSALDDQRSFVLTVTLLGMLPMCSILPWFLGLSGQHGKRAFANRLWPTGQSTLPLSDAAVGWTYMLRMIASSLMAAASAVILGTLWFLAVVIIIRVNGFTPAVRMDPAISQADLVRHFALLAFLLWVSAGFSSAATLTGRRWIASLPLSVIPAWIGLAMIAAIFPRLPPNVIFESIAYAVLTAALCLTIAAYVLDIMYGLISIYSLLAGVILFVGTESVGIWLVQSSARSGINSVPNQFMYTWIMLFALAASPPALIPWATYCNRHR